MIKDFVGTHFNDKVKVITLIMIQLRLLHEC